MEHVDRRSKYTGSKDYASTFAHAPWGSPDTATSVEGKAST